LSQTLNRLAFIAGKFIALWLPCFSPPFHDPYVSAAFFATGPFRRLYGARYAVIVFGLSAAAIALVFAACQLFIRLQFAPTAMALGLPLLAFARRHQRFLGKSWKLQDFGTGYSLDVLGACALLLLAVWVLAGICLACSTRLNVVWTLVVAFVVLCLGMILDWMILPRIQAADLAPVRVLWSSIYAIIPNFQAFWMLDALDQGKHITAFYILQALGYAACYIGAMLFLAYSLFLERQVGTANKI
jgi:hypothetical protein